MRTEQELVRGIQKRDPGIFEEFVRRFQPAVFFTSLRMLGERNEASDTAQEVFLKIWRFAPKLSDSVILDRWIYRVTINTCIDRMRSLRPHLRRQTGDNIVLFSVTEPGMNPREYAKRMEELNQVKEALGELSEKQRAVFVLRHFQNLKMQEISDILSIPVGTVKATLHQTFCKLKGLLQSERGENIVSTRPDCRVTG